jgi:hypothetical protein
LSVAIRTIYVAGEVVVGGLVRGAPSQSRCAGISHKNIMSLICFRLSTELKVGRVGAGWAGRSAEARAVAAGRAEAVECSGRTNVSKISPAVLARVCAAAADPQLLYCGRMGPAVPVLA